MKTSAVLAAVLAAFAASCAAQPALRGQDSDPQDPGVLLARGGDRPTPALPELAAPSLRRQVLEQEAEGTAPRGGGRRAFEEAPGAPDGQRQVALLTRDGEALDQSPRARELQSHSWGRVRQGEACGGLPPNGQDDFCGYCIDDDGEMYEGLLFWDVPDHEACLANCPLNNKFVGYEYLPTNSRRLHCICRYQDGTLTRDSCPDGYNGSDCYPSRSWIGEGPVAQGDGDSSVACRARRFCGDILFPVDSSDEYCGHCVNINDDFYEGILFYDVPSHEDCFALCPVSDKYVGYEYLPSEPSGLHCICRYEDGTVVREYCPDGICRNVDGTVTGNSCPDSHNDSNCRMSRSWRGEGPVARGNGDSHVACRARFADDDALAWALERALFLVAEAKAGRPWSRQQFDEWFAQLRADILAGEFQHGIVANLGRLILHAINIMLILAFHAPAAATTAIAATSAWNDYFDR